MINPRLAILFTVDWSKEEYALKKPVQSAVKRIIINLLLNDVYELIGKLKTQTGQNEMPQHYSAL